MMISAVLQFRAREKLRRIERSHLQSAHAVWSKPREELALVGAAPAQSGPREATQRNFTLATDLALNSEFRLSVYLPLGWGS